MIPAPVALFTYNRPAHTRRTVESLLANEEARYSDVTVFSDGPKSAADTKAVGEVRAYLRGVEGFKSFQIVERPANLGLANSIIQGVTAVCEAHERAIVLEDDLVTSPYFLRYINEALNLYANDPEVAAVHGYAYPIQVPLPETYFLGVPGWWGWGTWKRAWNHFNPDGAALLRDILQRRLHWKFDLGGAYPYTQLLRDQIEGRNDSWAVRWYASLFLLGKQALQPGRSLVQNIGFDGSGVHGENVRRWDSPLTRLPIQPERQGAFENAAARKVVEEFLWHVRIPRWPHRIARRFLAGLLRRINGG